MVQSGKGREEGMQLSAQPGVRFVIISSGIVFLIWGVGQAQSVLASVLVSVFFALLATPPVLWLQKKRVPVAVSVGIVVTAMILTLLATGAVVGTSIDSFYDALPHYQVQIKAQVAAFKIFLTHRGIAAPEKLLGEYVNPGAIMNLTAGLFTRLGSVFSNIILILLTVTFILLETTSFPRKIRMVLGDPQEVFPRFTRFVDAMKRYMVIKTLISLATGVLVAILLSLLQVDFPILWGFLAFLMNYVPTLGSTIAGVPAFLLALIQHGIGTAILAVIGYVAINFLLDYGIEKRLMGQKLGLSTLVVFLSLIFWGSVLGPIGAVLCIPLTISLKFAFEGNEGTRWIAMLLGPAQQK